MTKMRHLRDKAAKSVFVVPTYRVCGASCDFALYLQRAISAPAVLAVALIAISKYIPDSRRNPVTSIQTC